MRNKVHFIQLGCDKNRVDGEVMLGLLCNAGYEIIPEAELADAIIINTCGFIREAVQESIETVLEAAGNKESGCGALIVAGCMASRYKDEILKEIPEADAILPASEYGKIVSVLDSILREDSQDGLAGQESDRKEADVRKSEHALADGEYQNSLRLAGRKMTSLPHIAYVKISEGCDNRCTYCTIPSIRGGYAERPFDSVMDECRRLAADGARELVFVAQDTACHSAIANLMREAAKLDGVAWLRLMYAYPEHITDGLIDALASSGKICPYIDMPVQHASDTVLKRMGRKGTRADLLAAVKKLRERVPNIAIRTTLMVGFPGETEEEFAELCDFVREVRFDRLGVFAYSPEDGTPAAKMKGKVKKSEAAARRDRLMLIQREIHTEKQREYVGREVDVMVDAEADANTKNARGITAERLYAGRTARDAYEADAVVFFNAPGDKTLAPGEIIKVLVTGTDEYDLLGELI